MFKELNEVFVSYRGNKVALLKFLTDDLAYYILIHIGRLSENFWYWNEEEQVKHITKMAKDELDYPEFICTVVKRDYFKNSFKKLK